MEGVKRGKVRLVPHRPEWEEEFIRVKAELESVWGANVLDIQHVGSTAIRAISAKPILDVAVRLQDIREMDIGALTNLGYDYRGPQFGNEGYHLYVLRDGQDRSLRHIHCYDKEEGEFSLQVGFRDYLNAHRETALQYQEIKRALAEKYPDNRALYTKGKEAFIQSVFEKFKL